MSDSMLQTLSDFFENLSVQTLCILSVSLLALILTWKYFPKTSPVKHETPMTDDLAEETSSSGLLTRMKMARNDVIHSKLTAGMSQQQLQEEEQIEQEQLAAIFDLLRQQEDKFHVNSMQDVHSQLKLYRP